MRKTKTARVNKKKNRDVRKKQEKIKKVILDVYKPLGNALAILTVGIKYLKKHRALWDAEQSYLKPYWKGVITEVINKSTSLDEKYGIGMEDILEESEIERVVERTLVDEMTELQRSKISDVDYLLCKKFYLSLMCIQTVKLKFWKKYKNEVAYSEFIGELEKVFKVYYKFVDFWIKEIEPNVAELIKDEDEVLK